MVVKSKRKVAAKKARAGKKSAKAGAAAKKAAAKKPWKPKRGDMVIGVAGAVEGWRGELLAVNHTWFIIRWITDDQGGSRDGCQPGRVPVTRSHTLALDVKA